MDFGKKLKDIRKDNNLLQKEVADKLNIAESTYSHFESEDQIIPIKRLIAFSEIFNVSIDYIFSFTKDIQYKKSKKSTNTKISGERLKNFRKEKNLTLKELELTLNYSKTTIAGYESGRYAIATPFLYQICKKYNISADYLLGKIDSPKYLK